MSDTVSEDVKTRVAWLYYVEGMTQSDVADVVGLTRSRVLRILAGSRADGTVQIRVASKLSRCVELERMLEDRWKLERAIVVPDPQDASAVHRIIGGELGRCMSNSLKPDMSIGLGWGRTLSSSISALEHNGEEGMKVISLLGGLTRVETVNPSEFAWRVADRLAAECYMIAAPVYAPDRQTRDALLSHPGIAEVLQRAETLDMAVVSVGDLTPDSTLTRYGLLSKDEFSSLERHGVIGDILCRFVDENGDVVDCDLNDRVVSVDHRKLKNTRRLILASGGWRKTRIIRAALMAMDVAVLVTDQSVAERLAVSG